MQCKICSQGLASFLTLFLCECAKKFSKSKGEGLKKSRVKKKFYFEIADWAIFKEWTSDFKRLSRIVVVQLYAVYY